MIHKPGGIAVLATIQHIGLQRFCYKMHSTTNAVSCADLVTDKAHQCQESEPQQAPRQGMRYICIRHKRLSGLDPRQVLVDGRDTEICSGWKRRACSLVARTSGSATPCARKRLSPVRLLFLYKYPRSVTADAIAPFITCTRLKHLSASCTK